MKNTIMKNTNILSSWAGKAALLALLLTPTLNATNFNYFNSHQRTGGCWYGDAGTSDGGVTAWTYASYDNPGGTEFYIKIYDYYWIGVDQFTYDEIGPIHTNSIDGGRLWDSGSCDFAETVLEYSSDGTNYDWGAYGQAGKM